MNLDLQMRRLLKPSEVARILAVSVATLQDWRKRRRDFGPMFIKVGASIRYSVEGLRRYLMDRTVRPGERKGLPVRRIDRSAAPGEKK
jgi:hypothetical protein